LKYVSSLIVLALLGTSFILGSCEEYEPPPEVRLKQPQGGAFLPGDPLTLLFSQPIDPSTLQIRIWPDERDIEGAFLSTTKPVVDVCDLRRSPCGDLTIKVAADKMSADLNLDPEGLGKAGLPYVLNVMPGLANARGNDTGREIYFDYQFRSTSFENEEPVEFDDGVYIVVGSVTNPLPAILTLISDIKVLESGVFMLAGAEGDPISSEFPNNTSNPEELEVDSGSLGWTAYVTGFIQLRDGKRLLETQPVQIELPLGPLTVILEDVRLFGEIVKGTTGKDRIEGTLSFAKLLLINNRGQVTEYDGDAAAITADWVPPEIAPEGHPVVCGDLCGIVTGTCAPPDDFPAEGFCEAWEEEQQ